MFAARLSASKGRAVKFVAQQAVDSNATYVDEYTGTNTATIGSHQVGDVFIAFTSRDGSSTAPALPSGWTDILNGGTNSLGYRIAWKVAATTNETAGTWTNATSVMIAHIRPASGWTPTIGVTGTSGSSSATNLSFPSATLQNTDDTSWVFGFFAHRSADITNLSSAPSGMILCDTLQDATDSNALYRTDGPVTSWAGSSTTYGGTASTARTIVVELKLSYEVPVNVPTSPAANVSGNTITISWTDTNGGNAQHRIDTSPDGSSWTLLTTKNAGTNTHDITGASSGTTYYRIRAQIGASSSAYTSTVSATVSGGSGAGWQLATTNYIPRKFNMRIVHPSANAGVNAQCRNAYPGLPWTTYVDVVGGAYPFRFELVGAPAGMTIGQQLTQNGDILEPAEDYGMISWPSPSLGTYNITVNVYDQDYDRASNPSSVASVTFSLSVNTSNFVFIHPTTGNDGNDGTINSPFLSISKLHGGSSSTSTYNGKQVYLRGGTHDFDGMATNSNRYAIISGGAPNVFIGYPGETAIIEMYQGQCMLNTGSADTTFKDLTIQSAGDWTDDQYFFWVVAETDRHSWHNCTFTNFYGGTGTGTNNQAAIFYSNNDNGSSDIAISRCTFTGRMGCILDAYKVTHLSFQHNRGYALDTSQEQNASNQWDLIYLKDSTQNASIRANNFYESMTGVVHGGFVGVGGQNSSPAAAYSFNNIEYCYNRLAQFNDASIFGVYEYDVGPVGSVYGYRNSCLGDVQDYINNPPATNFWQNNVIVQGFTNMINFTGENNTTGVGTLDSNAKLTGATRTNYLGIRGAEVA